METRKTALYECHKNLGAKFVPFAGYEMPVQYSTGIVEEHKLTRNKAGLFDVSHMGQLSIEGNNELVTELEKIIPTDLKNIKLNQSKYSFLTNKNGGIHDDLIITKVEKGFKVILNAASARRENLLQDLSKINSNIHSFPLDVTDLENAKNVFENILKKNGDIDLCVFGAAIYDPNYEKEINEKKIREIMEVNFFGVVNCIKTVEKYFKIKKKGHISIISSIAGYRGLPRSEGYGASKAALNNLVESLYLDFKKNNIRISLISPGFIRTPMTDKNKFRMPFIRSAEFAANKIYKGIVYKKSFEITFPKQLTIILKFFRILPYKIYFFLIEKLTKNTKR